MNEFLYLVPLVLGVGILVLGIRLQTRLGLATGRLVMGGCFVACSFLFWLSTAMLAVSQHSFWLLMNLATVTLFFAGLAFFVPPPARAECINQHSPVGNTVVLVGFIFGSAHALALLFTTSWPAFLIDCYTRLGLGTPTP